MSSEIKVFLFTMMVVMCLMYSEYSKANEINYTYQSTPWSFYKAREGLYVMEIKYNILDEDAYKELPNQLSALTINDSLEIQTSTPGGNMGGLAFILKSINESKHKTWYVHVIGPTKSAGAILSCNADSIVMDKGTFLMWHSAKMSPSLSGPVTATELQNLANIARRVTSQALSPCVSKGIIDRYTASRIIDDKSQLYKLSDGYYFENLNNPGQ